jgi:hypothetical protein
MNVYREALYSQKASNLGALVHGFSRVITQLQAQARVQGKGTDWINGHPVCVLFADQLRALSGYGPTYVEAFTECETKAAAPESDAVAIAPAITDDSNMNGVRIERRDETLFIPLPRVLWRKIENGCKCQHCVAVSASDAYWDTLAISLKNDEQRPPRNTACTVHYPELQGAK